MLKHRKKQKEIAVEYKGGKCIICGYNKCKRSLEFHHENGANDKDFSVSKMFGNKSLDLIKEELDKCILVCSNCHGEIHNNLILEKYKELL